MPLYRIENALPSGYVRNGSVDYTIYLQAAINANESVLFPDFPIMVNETGIIPPSNRELIFSYGSKLVMKPNALGSYNVIRIQRVSNVVVHNAVIAGDRESHLGTTGEWGHGIGLYGSDKITINNLIVSQCWGDGLYLASKDGVTNTNIIVNDISSTYCRRNGISLASGNGVTFNNPYCGYTSGVDPSSGIDIEPSNLTDEIQNIVINNPRTEKSLRYGIMIGLSALSGSNIDKNISVKIINWRDTYSDASLRASFNPKAGFTGRVMGTIDIINPLWKYNKTAPWQVDIRTPDILLNVIKPLMQVNLEEADTLPILTSKYNLNANYNLSF